MADKNRNGNGIFDTIVYVMMAMAVIFVVVMSVCKMSETAVFKIILGIWIVIAIAIADFVGPLLRKRFDEVSRKAAYSYTIYAICDGVFYVGIYVCIINLRNTGDILHYVFLGAGIAAFIVKTVFYNRFKADADEEFLEEESEPENRMEEASQDNEEDEDMKVFIFREKENKN